MRIFLLLGQKGFRLLVLLALVIIASKSIHALPNSESKPSKLISPSSNDISYYLEPFYDVNVFRIIVVLEFKGNPTGETQIQIPDYFEGKNSSDGLKFLKTLSQDSYLIDTDRPNIKTVKHAPNASLKIYYQVEEVRDDDIESSNQHMATIQRKYFHFLAETFFITPIFDLTKEMNFRLSWTHFPKNWSFGNSFGVNEKAQAFTSTLKKFRTSLFTGGDYKILKRFNNGIYTYMAIRGKWNFTNDQLMDIISNIIKVQKDYLNDNSTFSFVAVLQLNAGEILGGIGRSNGFSISIPVDKRIDYSLKREIASQAFNQWITDKITFAEPSQICYWFKFGFANFYARLILLRSDIITLDEYVQDYNNVLRQYFTSWARREKNEILLTNYWDEEKLVQLPIQRGDIIAHNLNAAIIRNSSGKLSLDDFMLDLQKRSTNEALQISNGSLSALIRYYAGEQSLSEIMSVLNSAAQMKINPDALGPCFNVQYDNYKKFYLIGETFNVPYYLTRNPDGSFTSSCADWFMRRR